MLKFEEEISAKQAIERWDAGGNLWTVEMGGLGPGYEQAIQVAAIEILRDAIGKTDDLSTDDFQVLADKTIHTHNETLGGLTGAQAGAASQLAFKAYRNGWSGMLEDAQKQGIEDGRFKQISKAWPRATERTG